MKKKTPSPAQLKNMETLAKAIQKIKPFIFSGEDQPINFPVLSKCSVCGGYCKTDKFSAEEAFLLATLQHGYYLAKWEGHNVANSDIFPSPCTCKCNHVFKEVNIGRCLHRWTCKKCKISLVVDSSD